MGFDKFTAQFNNLGFNIEQYNHGPRCTYKYGTKENIELFFKR